MAGGAGRAGRGGAGRGGADPLRREQRALEGDVRHLQMVRPDVHGVGGDGHGQQVGYQEVRRLVSQDAGPVRRVHARQLVHRPLQNPRVGGPDRQHHEADAAREVGAEEAPVAGQLAEHHGHEGGDAHDGDDELQVVVVGQGADCFRGALQANLAQVAAKGRGRGGGLSAAAGGAAEGGEPGGGGRAAAGARPTKMVRRFTPAALPQSRFESATFASSSCALTTVLASASAAGRIEGGSSRAAWEGKGVYLTPEMGEGGRHSHTARRVLFF